MRLSFDAPSSFVSFPYFCFSFYPFSVGRLAIYRLHFLVHVSPLASCLALLQSSLLHTAWTPFIDIQASSSRASTPHRPCCCFFVLLALDCLVSFGRVSASRTISRSTVSEICSASASLSIHTKTALVLRLAYVVSYVLHPYVSVHLLCESSLPAGLDARRELGSNSSLPDLGFVCRVRSQMGKLSVFPLASVASTLSETALRVLLPWFVG